MKKPMNKNIKKLIPHGDPIWVNNKHIIFKKVVKPCRICGFCPYGQLVEMFPFTNKKMSCEVFGHDCPVFYHAEQFSEECNVKNDEVDDMMKEFNKRFKK